MINTINKFYSMINLVIFMGKINQAKEFGSPGVGVEVRVADCDFKQGDQCGCL